MLGFLTFFWGFWLVIFFSRTAAPLPDPTPTPPNTPKRTRNGPETDPKQTQTDPKKTDPKRTETDPKWTEVKPSGVGRPGGLSGWGGVYMGKIGSICHFPRALPASIWGHCSQVLVFTSIWGTQKGVWQWRFSCYFSQHLGSLKPPSTAKQGKTENDKSTLFYPPTSLIFFSLVFWFSLVFTTQGHSLVFWVLSLFFSVFLGVLWGSEGPKNPWCFGWFSLVFT